MYSRNKRTILKIDAELRFFLPRQQRNVEIQILVPSKRSIKDLIESLGVPHVEIGALQVNGKPVDLNYPVEGGEYIEVHAPTLPIALEDLSALYHNRLSEFKFIADVHLGKLTHLLRLLGFDTLYRNHIDDERIARVSYQQKRILLTRDRNLLKRKCILLGYCLRSTQPEHQLRELWQRYPLKKHAKPFSRCIVCNSPLVAVKKQQVINRLPPRVAKFQHEFSQCKGCGRVYWKGSHYKKLSGFIHDLFDMKIPQQEG
ncbi:MAG: twitching motility protein PilT [Calditrichaeota bacterium]|nr:MAG: twitching motility protein PilT [Calditrichota bacterium]